MNKKSDNAINEKEEFINDLEKKINEMNDMLITFNKKFPGTYTKNEVTLLMVSFRNTSKIIEQIKKDGFSDESFKRLGILSLYAKLWQDKEITYNKFNHLLEILKKIIGGQS